MNKKYLIFLLVAGQFALPAGVRAGSYDVTADFSTNSNPNGVWSYGYAEDLGGSLILYTEPSNPATSVFSWVLDGGDPLVGSNQSDDTYSPGTPVLPPHQAFCHPGQNGEYSIFRFTAPAAGTYQLQAAWVGDDSFEGTSTDVHVLLNDASIFDGFVTGFGPGTGPSFSTNLVLQSNDRIDFEVGDGGNGYICDSTGIQATLNTAPSLGIQLVSPVLAQLSWSINFQGFSLESATNLAAAAWVPVTNSVAIHGEQFTVMVATSLPQQYFRLSN